MTSLDAYRHARLSLDDLVDAANDLLPLLLPPDIQDQRLKEEVTPRLVRHYATQGSLDEPEREGREVRYTYRHLLQLLALRRLQAEGYRTGSVTPITTAMTEPELEDLLRGGRQVALTQAPNPALQFLEGLRTGSPAPRPASPPPASLPSRAATRWTRHEIAPDLELHVREDFRFPVHSPEQTRLFQQIDHALRQHQGSTRRSK